jgi:signal transduction histidine kinase
MKMENILQTVLDAAINGLVALQAVRDEQGSIRDFSFLFINQSAQQLFGRNIPPGSLHNHLFPGAVPSGLFTRYVTAVETQKKQEAEINLPYDDWSHQYLMVVCPAEDGLVIAFENITARKKAQRELSGIRKQVQQVLNAPNVQVSVFQSVRDESGEIIDFLYLMISRQGAESLGRSDLPGKRLFEVYPRVRQELAGMQKVVATGVTYCFETHFTDEGLDLWLVTSCARFNDGLIVVWEDITQRKKDEAALRHSHQLLKAIFDSTPVLLGFLQAIRNEQGEVEDFIIAKINESNIQFAKHTGMEAGQQLSQALPHIKEHEMYRMICEVLETGIPHRLETYYGYDGFDTWLDAYWARLDEGVLSSLLDITDRKKTEEQTRKNLAILQQAEELARLGSWEYDIAGDAFAWSAGMYQLFGLAPGDRIKPEIYLDYALPADKRSARLLIKNLRQGAKPFEITLRIQVGAQIKTLKIKALVLADEQGRPGKVLGVNLDLTALKRLEADNLAIKLNQQKELLMAILTAQEEERKRIAESLHNGLGQQLYAIKLNLDQIVLAELPAGSASSREAKQKADRLLAEAIDQTRTLSHQLLPGILEDMGLGIAIKDICKIYNSPQLAFQCQVSHLPKHLDKTLQLAIYRIVQELANNIVKHAQATEASLQIRKIGQQVALLAEDNGTGFNQGQALGKGIGLKAIKDRVKLMNGTMEIDSEPGKGTMISIYLPIIQQKNLGAY